ncbi:hypothetical protein [Streptomyces sp. enrichment culture]|uniref:hypothetical protein n=1 Tax=Streptomyces sp. enrichment culture TaxID=1795815 RepID=UPI003F565069
MTPETAPWVQTRLAAAPGAAVALAVLVAVTAFLVTAALALRRTDTAVTLKDAGGTGR